jgi:hypothetical protein
MLVRPKTVDEETGIVTTWRDAVEWVVVEDE